MNLKEFSQYDALGLAQLVKEGKVTPKELVDLAIEGIEKTNPEINAVISVLKDEAYKAIEEGLPEGDFQGVPLLIKEIVLHAANVPHSSGSKFAENIVVPIDSYLMEYFRKAGFVLVGTTTTPEFAYNATTESVLNGATHNPWALGHSSGGSSGGAAASVAAGIVPIAHGNDGGGSIRIPAANCGVIGLKPSRGRVSMGPFNAEALAGNGIEFALTKTIRDTAALLDAVSLEKPGEYCYAPNPEGYASFKDAIKEPVRKLRIAYTTENAGGSKPSDDVVKTLNETVELLRSLGHEVVEEAPQYDGEAYLNALHKMWTVSVNHMIHAVADLTGRVPSAENLEAMNWQTYLEGEEISAPDYCAATDVLHNVTRQVGKLFENYDVLLTPTMAAEATKFGVLDANNPNQTTEQFFRKMLGEVAPYTALFNTTGQPAITLPLHESANGLPLGMQFVGHAGAEATLLQLGEQLEKAIPWTDRKPVVHVSNDVVVHVQ